MHETINSSCLVAQILEAVHAMCNPTGRAVRSVLQKLSVTQVSKKAFRHETVKSLMHQGHSLLCDVWTDLGASSFALRQAYSNTLMINSADYKDFACWQPAKTD